MRINLRRVLSVVLSTILATTVTPMAHATTSYQGKDTAEFYSIVEAGYTSVASESDPTKDLIFVVSNDTNNSVLQWVSPANHVIDGQLTLTSANTDGVHAWKNAVDMAISTDGLFAFIVFQGDYPVVAKVDLTLGIVVDHFYLDGYLPNSGGMPLNIGLRDDISTVNVYGSTDMETLHADTLEHSTWAGLRVLTGTGVQSFGFDATLGNVTFPERADGPQYSNDLGDVSLHYPSGVNWISSNFGTGVSVYFSALALQTGTTNMYLGTNVAGADQVLRVSPYTDNYPTVESLNLPSTFDGVRQLAASTDGTQLVVLSNNHKIARIPLGRGWMANLIDVYDVASTGATMWDNSFVVVSPDGTTATYFDSHEGDGDNIVTVALANNAATISQPAVDVWWYAYSRKKAEISWTVPADNGGSEITQYVVQCKVKGSSKKYKTVKRVGPEANSAMINRNKTKKLKCRVIVKNAIGNSSSSNVITVTKRGAAAPNPW